MLATFYRLYFLLIKWVFCKAVMENISLSKRMGMPIEVRKLARVGR